MFFFVFFYEKLKNLRLHEESECVNNRGRRGRANSKGKGSGV